MNPLEMFSGLFSNAEEALPKDSLPERSLIKNTQKGSPMKHLVVDIDQTLVNSGVSWWRWMEDLCEVSIPFPALRYTLGPESIEYDLSSYFIEAYLKSKGLHSSNNTPQAYEMAHTALLSYWGIPTLYLNLKPYKGASRALQRVSEAGWWITFASYTKKGHMGSKFDFLDREFPFIKWGLNGSFVATQEKGCLKADAVIDDRHLYLNQFKDEKCKKILFNTPYTQCQNLEVYATLLTDWENLPEILGI